MVTFVTKLFIYLPLCDGKKGSLVYHESMSSSALLVQSWICVLVSKFLQDKSSSMMVAVAPVTVTIKKFISSLIRERKK